MDVNAVGARIREARERAGYTQEALARAADMTAQSVYRYERGRMEPGVARLERIAALLGVSIDWLVNGDQPREAAS